MGDYELANNVVELHGVKKTIHDHEILHNINLEVKEGEFLTLLGPSGCGKTTLLRLISGFENPTAGTICIDGKDVGGLPPHQRHVHTVFQSYALFPHMTVFENVAFGLRVKPNTESLSANTTRSVVTAITLVILVDAVFAIMTRNVGIPQL